MDKSARFFFLIFLAIVVCAALFGGCATPNSAWVAGGNRSAEVGVLAPVVGTGQQVEIEASVERREEEDTTYTPGKLHPCDQGSHKGWQRGSGNKHRIDPGTYSTEEDDQVLGRLGVRWNLVDWAHVAVGTTEELGAYVRLGLSKQLTRECSIGVDLLSDRGEEVLIGLKWSR